MISTLRRTSRALAAVVPSVLIAVLGVGGVAAAAGPPVTCGATLKSNAVLTRDLTCSTGVTLYRGVTLDLGGHTLTGPGSSGVAVTMSYKGGSSVINGRITKWGTGVSQDGSANTDANPAVGTIKRVTLTNAPTRLFLTSGVNIVNSTFVNSPVRFMYANVTASGSSFTKSSVTGSQGLVTIAGSKIVGGTVDSNDSRGVVIDSSSLDGTGFNGSFVGCFDAAVSVSNSIVKNYPSAFTPGSCSTVLTSNSFSNNPGGVLRFYTADTSNGSAAVRNNTFTTSGIVLEGINYLTITGNTFTANTTGVYVRNPQDRGEISSDTNSVVTGNTFSKNTSSGIRSLATALTVGTNTAVNNGRYGIYAPQANDLGGNVASGNTLGNCVGLPCATN